MVGLKYIYINYYLNMLKKIYFFDIVYWKYLKKNDDMYVLFCIELYIYKNDYI